MKRGGICNVPNYTRLEKFGGTPIYPDRDHSSSDMRIK